MHVQASHSGSNGSNVLCLLLKESQKVDTMGWKHYASNALCFWITSYQDHVARISKFWDKITFSPQFLTWQIERFAFHSLPCWSLPIWQNSKLTCPIIETILLQKIVSLSDSTVSLCLAINPENCSYMMSRLTTMMINLWMQGKLHCESQSCSVSLNDHVT